MAITDFRDLTTYQLSKELIGKTKLIVDQIEFQQRELARNLIKTACQIGPEIAEGYGRNHQLMSSSDS